MPRRRKSLDPLADLPRIMEILERELLIQREAMDKLKQKARVPTVVRTGTASLPIRRSA